MLDYTMVGYDILYMVTNAMLYYAVQCYTNAIVMVCYT